MKAIPESGDKLLKALGIETSINKTADGMGDDVLLEIRIHGKVRVTRGA